MSGVFAGKLVEMFKSLSPFQSFTMSRGPASAAFLKSSATEMQKRVVRHTGSSYVYPFLRYMRWEPLVRRNIAIREKRSINDKTVISIKYTHS